MGLLTPIQSAKFDERVQLVPFSTCHYWAGEANSAGYGIFSRKRAHRVAYERVNGPIPPQINGSRAVIRHRCDNPLCVNPDHLEIGTQADNMADMAKRNRARSGQAHHNARITAEQAMEIVAAVEAGERVVDVAARFGITPGLVSSLRYGRTKWIKVEAPTGRSDRRISDEVARAIYAAKAARVRVKSLMEKYSVTRTMVSDIWRGATYASVTGHRR